MRDDHHLPPTLALAAAAALAIGLFAPSAHAERRWELGGFAGFQTFADGNRLSIPDDVSTASLQLPKDRAPFWGARLSYAPLPHFALELEVGQSPTSFSDTQVDVSTLLYRLQMVGHFQGPGPGLKPFVLVGIGGMRGAPSDSLVSVDRDGGTIELMTSTETDFEFHFGLGVKYQLGESLGARAELRYRRAPSAAEEGTAEFEGLLGVYVRI